MVFLHRQGKAVIPAPGTRGSSTRHSVMDPDYDFMHIALKQARKSYEEDGVPVGAILVENGNVIAVGHNKRVQQNDPTAHGEMDCIRNAGRRARYHNVSRYTTLSPCMMCPVQ
nr:nucleoside deaminase [Chlorobium sp.]